MAVGSNGDEDSEYLRKKFFVTDFENTFQKDSVHVVVSFQFFFVNFYFRF